AEREGLSFERLLDGKDANGARISNDSFWDKASARLVNEHTGDFRMVMPSSPGNSAATDREAPTANLLFHWFEHVNFVECREGIPS
ncbi:MAG TPA: hypothetical protein PKK99_14385, partial [Bacteroidia bacterium]|nr:hypothetical protein [Bacteroidia bacterium]